VQIMMRMRTHYYTINKFFATSVKFVGYKYKTIEIVKEGFLKTIKTKQMI